MTLFSARFQHLLRFCLLGMSALLLSSCGGGAGTVGTASGTALYTTAPSAIVIALNAPNPANFSIGGGTAPYRASSSNVGVAKVEAIGTKLSLLGLASGIAQITVTDATGTAITISVTVGNANVDLFSTAPAAVNLTVGAATSFTIGGGLPGYMVSSSNKAVATVAINGNSFIILGLANGTAQIAVFDSAGTALTIAVTVGTDGVVIPLYMTAAGAISTDVSEISTISIGGGTPPYAATSSNASVATVSMSGTTLKLTSLAKGTAKILVFDASGNSVTTSVTVGSTGSNIVLFVAAPSAIFLAAGTRDPYLYTVGGGVGPYTVSTGNTAIATATISGNSLSIKGIASGTTPIVVFDSLGATVTVTVTVGAGSGTSTTTPLFTTAASAVSISIGATGTYTIGGGTAPYSATTSAASVATSLVSGNSLTITGIAAGTAEVLVFDATGTSKLIGVTTLSASGNLLNVLPDGATGNVGDLLQFLVSGGTPPYTITVNNAAIASVTPGTVATSGGNITATLLNSGSTNLTLVDSLGLSKAISLTAAQISSSLRLSPDRLLIAEDSTGNIVLNVFGGTAPYRAFTSDQTLSSVSTTGSTVTVALGSNLNRCINPIDTSGIRVPTGTFDVTIMVIDNLGASATAIMTIKDNGVGTGIVNTQPAPFVAPCT